MRHQDAVRDHVVAAVWGFAEATVFFVVPDLWLSWVALRNRKRALACTVTATAGALAGGACTYAWARSVGRKRSGEALARIPAITPRMVQDVAAAMGERPVKSLLTGPFRGTPYKLYARAAAVHRQPPTALLAWSIPGRAPRFVLVTAAIGAVGASVRQRRPYLSERTTVLLFATGWTAFYGWYFPTVTRRNAPRVHDERDPAIQ